MSSPPEEGRRADAAVSPSEPYSLFAGSIHLAAGLGQLRRGGKVVQDLRRLACGFTGLAAGYAIGIVGDAVSLPSVSCTRAHYAVRSSVLVRLKSLRLDGPDPHLRVRCPHSAEPQLTCHSEVIVRFTRAFCTLSLTSAGFVRPHCGFDPQHQSKCIHSDT